MTYHLNKPEMCAYLELRDQELSLDNYSMRQTLRGEPSVETIDKKFVNYLDPQPETMTDYAIAYGLSQEVRWGGQGRYWYSVAQHSINVANLVWKMTHDVPTTRAALLHDATEAFMKDIPSPLKRLLPGYRYLESKMAAVIMQSRGLNYPYPPPIEHADRVMAINEDAKIMGTPHELLQARHPGETKAVSLLLEDNEWHHATMSPKEAFNEFMDFNSMLERLQSI